MILDIIEEEPCSILCGDSYICWNKYILLDTESTTIITISNHIDFESSTMKSMLIVFYFVSGMRSRCNSPKGRCYVSLVYKQRSQMLTC